MYAAYFGLSEAPFSIAPDPRYLYMSDSHREAMAHLLFGLEESGGFVQLTGEVGTGKTTLCRRMLTQLPDKVNVALIVNPRISENELLEAICDELSVRYPPMSSIKDLQSRLNEYLLDQHAQGCNTVLIIDESQNLSSEVLEQIRLLTNLETETRKLLQIILIGQTELNAILAKDELRQLAQRVTARYHLRPLTSVETHQYIAHRLSVAGGKDSLFTSMATRWVHRLSKGIPRIINVICDRALMGAYSHGKKLVTTNMIRTAATEIMGKRQLFPWFGKPALWLGVLAALVLTPFVVDKAKEWSSGSVEVAESSLFQPDRGKQQHHGKTAAGSDESSVNIVEKEQLAQSVDGELSPPFAALEPANAAVLSTVEQSETRQSTTGESLSSAWLAALNALSDSSERGFMLQRLVKLWNLPPDVVSDCITVNEVGLSCVADAGDWESVLDFNRPALLEVSLQDGGRRYLLLKNTNGEQIDVLIGEETYSLSLDELAERWLGRFTLLWRPPPLQAVGVTPYSEDEDVRWLRRAINIIASNYGGAPLADPDNHEFDAALRDRIIEFQRQHRIADSGIAGIDTLIKMNTLLHPNSVPVLTN